MAGKRESLREGKAIELEPGVQGRLNFQDKTLELSDGRKLSISEKNKKELFPANPEAKKYAQQKEEVERNIKSNPFGEFLHQFGQKGVIGGIKNWGDKLTHTGDEYLRLKKAEQDVGERISEESPWVSRGATAASFIPDIALTHGMSAATSAPLLAGISAGPRILEEPGQVAAEAGLSAIGGKLIDKGGQYLSKVAARRAASRELPAQQAAVRAENLAGQQATNEANIQQRQSFNALQERTKNENAALLHQHNLTLNDRQNNMIQSRNAFEQAKAARESEVFRLENEYKTAKAERSANAERLGNEYKQAKLASEQETKRLNDEFLLAQKQYQESLKDLPRLQKEAQAEYSKNVIKNVEDIQKAFPHDARILGKQIDSQGFINDSINSTGLAGSKEGAQATRILKSLFPEGELLTAKELSKRYQAIEDAIQRSSPEVQGILNQFKEHLGTKLPVILEDSIAYSKIMPALGKSLEKDIALVIKEIPFGKGEEKTRSLLLNRANSNLKNLMREISPDDFTQKLQSGEIGRRIKDSLLSSEDFLTDAGFSNFSKLRKQGLLGLAEKELGAKHSYFVNEIEKRINNTLARNELKSMQAGKLASKKLGRDLKKTYGLAEPVAPPSSPLAPEPVASPQLPSELPQIARPNLPAPLNPPIEPPMPLKPSLNPEPSVPSPNSFIAQPEPTLGAASNLAEHAGDFLEKPLRLGGKNNLLKLAGLKYALGKAALPVEAGLAGAYGGAKLLTAPGSAGQAARMSFKQGGIQAIESLAQKYPSYHDGILENPQERRSLTKEIEDDPEIPLEQKAVLQSKINRGKPFQSPF